MPQNDSSIFGTAAGNTIIGPQALDKKGTLYEIFGTSTTAENLLSGFIGQIDNLYMGVSHDGRNWNAYRVTPPAASGKKSFANIFPVLAVDSAGTVYAAWSEQADDANGNPAGPIALKLTHSGDGGQHWSTPVSVNAKGVNSAVLPWIVARGPGQVDLVYVGSSTTHNPDDATANWYAYQAQTTDPDDHAVSELATDRVGALSPFGDLVFPLPADELPYVHPVTDVNR